MGCAAGIGYSTKPPYDDLHIGLFHACFSGLLAVMVWGVFHLCGFHHLPRNRVLAAGAISVLAWALLLVALLAALRGIERSKERQHLLELRTQLTSVPEATAG